MTMGGIAHGIGAALYEEFAYNEEGQLIAQNFMDYLLPSSHEVPVVEIVHHVTPSPHTVFGQKGSGESGYLGAPAAIASAVNDAVRPLGIVVNSLPIKIARLGDMIAAARDESKNRLRRPNDHRHPWPSGAARSARRRSARSARAFLRCA